MKKILGNVLLIACTLQDDFYNVSEKSRLAHPVNERIGLCGKFVLIKNHAIGMHYFYVFTVVFRKLRVLICFHFYQEFALSSSVLVPSVLLFCNCAHSDSLRPGTPKGVISVLGAPIYSASGMQMPWKGALGITCDDPTAMISSRYPCPERVRRRGGIITATFDFDTFPQNTRTFLFFPFLITTTTFNPRNFACRPERQSINSSPDLRFIPRCRSSN